MNTSPDGTHSNGRKRLFPLWKITSALPRTFSETVRALIILDPISPALRLIIQCGNDLD